MKQIYTPNIHIGAVRGWCLKYVDDAGNAPNRTATARYAFQVEQKAGRVRTTEIPDNVWVVGFMDFTAGMYTTYGHVFFIRRSGKKYEIYDSEVQGGARKPYGSIEEILAWFGAYNPIYLGWSTHCDGREYAKEETMEKMSKHEMEQAFWSVSGYKPSPKELDGWYNKDESYKQQMQRLIDYFGNDPHSFNYYRRQAEKKIKDLEKRIKELEDGDFVKVTDLYIKKG